MQYIILVMEDIAYLTARDLAPFGSHPLLNGDSSDRAAGFNFTLLVKIYRNMIWSAEKYMNYGIIVFATFHTENEVFIVSKQ